MSLISQCVSSLDTPGLREALLLGGERADWERVFDDAARFRHDDTVLRVRENEARREEYRREQERKLVWCMPAPGGCSVARPHIFRALFSKDIGGVAGESDPWFDGDYAAVDGVSGNTQSLIDYIDNTHAISQPSAPLQSVLPSAEAALGGAKCLVLTSAQQYDSTRAPARWKWCHDGNSLEIFAALKGGAPVSTQVWFSTGNSGAVASLEGIILNGTPNTLRFGFGATLGNQTAGTFTNNEAFYINLQRTSPAYAVLKKTTGATGSFAATNASNPPSPLRIGARTDGTFRAALSLRSWFGFHRTLNTAERAVARSKIQVDTGLV